MKLYIAYIIAAFAFLPKGNLLQQNGPIQFNYYYRANDTSSDLVTLKVTNLSAKSIYYYSIGIEGLSDTGWVTVLSNLDALGQNEWFGLKPLQPGSIVKKTVSKKQIFLEYYYMKKIRFFLGYGEKKDLTGKEQYLYSEVLS